MEKVLYLTADEQTSFAALPVAVRGAWEIEAEQLTEHYETPEQINMRFRISDFRKFPELLAIVERLKGGVEPSEEDFETLGPTLQCELFFAIGARGVAGLLLSVLADASTPDDVEAIAQLSQVRHTLLQTNASNTL